MGLTGSDPGQRSPAATSSTDSIRLRAQSRMKERIREPAANTGRPATGSQKANVIDWPVRGSTSTMSKLASGDSSRLDSINPSLTRYGRQEPAPVLPLRDEPDLLSWLETSGRLVADEETASTEVSTVEEEELSALMGEKEDYNQSDEQPEEDWED